MVKRKFPYILVVDPVPKEYQDDIDYFKVLDWIGNHFLDNEDFIWNPSYVEVKDVIRYYEVLAFRSIDFVLLFKLQFPEAVLEFRNLNEIR